MSQGRRQKFARTFGKVRVNAVFFFGISGFWVGFWASKFVLNGKARRGKVCPLFVVKKLSAPSPGDDLRSKSAIRLRGETVRSDSFWEIGCDFSAVTIRWKSKFLYRYRPEGIFRIFFGLILDPPPVHMLLQRKKANSFVPAIFFPMAWPF